jgi:DNA-binding CsgD family transcriptional regulator
MPRDDHTNETTDAENRSAIVEVIRAETQAFLDEDFEAWAACWVHDERTEEVYLTRDTGLTTIIGWRDIAANMQRVFDKDLGCQMVRFRQENHRINVQGRMALVLYDGWEESRDGLSWGSLETRVLERQADRWRIVFSSFVQRHEWGEAGREISVDGQGRIVWASPESLDRLKTHPVLTVSAGRLRARRSTWDKVLQREIVRAGQSHGHYELQRYINEAGGPLQYPVVLGETDAGGLALAHVSVRDCVTYLRLDSDAQLGRRLKTAKAVFNLSDGQTRLAELIAGGDGLKAAAETLGISINTARTHLTRLYEKTGVNSQTALVRLLLSVS